jgi:hypothetical protein
VARAVLAGSIVVGSAAACYYAWAGLTLSHYDARAHLVVARRIADSLTPGWRQIGAVWLPLPHVLNAPLVWIDASYRTGFTAVAISVLSLSLGLAALARLVVARTGSRAAAFAGPALILLNPNVLYLQSTPMTEPLLFGLSLLALERVDAWLAAPSPIREWSAGWALAMLVLTRYEGWCIAAALMAVAAVGVRGRSVRLLLYPGTAILAFLLLGWASSGNWFVMSGFFVPDNPARHQPVRVLADVASGTSELAGRILVAAAVLGAATCLVRVRREWTALLPLALVAAVALPAVAFYQGHPFRVRYMAPMIVASGALAAWGLARLRPSVRAWAAAALVLAVWVERPPLDPRAGMVVEAQWETPYRLERRAVTRYLDTAYDGSPILASMGSLAHYMQETSAHGLAIANFIHEGNGDLWAFTVESPRRHARWMLIEERAEGGDALAARAKAAPSYLDGFARVAEGGGLALYRRIE